MAGEWVETTLGDVVELKRGYDLPKRDRTKGFFPLVSSSGVTDCHSQAKVKGPGVVTGRYGTLGQVFYVAEDFWPLNTTLYVRDFKGNDPRFISYFLTGVNYLAYSDKAAVPGLNRNHLHQAAVRFPQDIREQLAIARILGTLDDKIDLNRQMSETLEAMARALFKSWFVDFGPVRAKAERQDTGLPREIAELFPDRLVDSELGNIPDGWEVESLGDVAEAVKGRSYKSAELAESTTALVTLKSFARGGGYRPDGLKAFTGTFRPEQVVRPGELIVACTDVTQAAEVIGRPAIVQPDSRYSTLVASLDALIVRPTCGSIGRAFLYFLMRTDPFVDHTFAHTTGTTVLHLAKNAVPSFSFVCPPSELVGAFESIARPALERVRLIGEEAGSLISLRDALLPKLISGELRVKDAENFVAKASA